jgi:hypothetical protein
MTLDNHVVIVTNQLSCGHCDKPVIMWSLWQTYLSCGHVTEQFKLYLCMKVISFCFLRHQFWFINVMSSWMIRVCTPSTTQHLFMTTSTIHLSSIVHYSTTFQPDNMLMLFERMWWRELEFFVKDLTTWSIQSRITFVVNIVIICSFFFGDLWLWHCTINQSYRGEYIDRWFDVVL